MMLAVPTRCANVPAALVEKQKHYKGEKQMRP